MTIRGHLAPVFPLPLCHSCRHLWAAHWSDTGCQAPTGPDTVCGCRQPPPDDPERPDDPEPPDEQDHDHDHDDQDHDDEEDRAA
jgi:hypothetical protein